jgi:hypothetical protein
VFRLRINFGAGLALATALALSACSGFAEVVDGAINDGAPPSDARSDGPAGDGPGDGQAPGDGEAPDLGGKLGVGACCGKKEDCASALCLYLGGGPAYCSATCTASADSCPVGYGCIGGRCMPLSEHYECGAHVAQAKPQGLGGCCGKATDCTSGLCRAVGSGAYFCSQSCTTSPDTCPVKYSCGSNKECGPSGAYSCSYK